MAKWQDRKLCPSNAPPAAMPALSASSPLPPLLSMQGVCKRFDNVTALSGVALDVRGGWFVDNARQREGARACLQRLGVDIDPDIEVSTLSIAQQQMVEIAKALSMQARLLIMDEPTSSLGEADAARLLNVVQDLKR